MCSGQCVTPFNRQHESRDPGWDDTFQLSIPTQSDETKPDPKNESIAEIVHVLSSRSREGLGVHASGFHPSSVLFILEHSLRPSLVVRVSCKKSVYLAGPRALSDGMVPQLHQRAGYQEASA